MKLSLRIVYTVAVVGLIFLVLMWVSDPFSDEEGSLDLVVYDTDETVVVDETYAFYEDDTLFSVMDRHHDLVCADRGYDPDPTCEAEFGHYGRVLLGIDDILTDWDNTFLYLEVDGAMAHRGIDTVELDDGSEYVWHVREAD
ncbi:MAG: hypothetical protein ACOCU5_00325 [Bacillota bacterium]